MKRNTYYIEKHYRRGYIESQLPGGGSGHLVAAPDEADALRILIKHKIGHKAKVTRYIIMKAPIELVERRMKGVGGKIFFEDKDGKLQKL